MDRKLIKNLARLVSLVFQKKIDKQQILVQILEFCSSGVNQFFSSKNKIGGFSSTKETVALLNQKPTKYVWIMSTNNDITTQLYSRDKRYNLCLKRFLWLKDKIPQQYYQQIDRRLMLSINQLKKSIMLKKATQNFCKTKINCAPLQKGSRDENIVQFVQYCPTLMIFTSDETP